MWRVITKIEEEKNELTIEKKMEWWHTRKVLDGKIDEIRFKYLIELALVISDYVWKYSQKDGLIWRMKYN